MVTNKEQIYNWLNAGLQQPVDRVKELFYFDKREKEFFSILITDYFLFDENFNIASDTTSNYSLQNIEKLREKLIRIENKSSEVLALPRLGTVLESEYLLADIDSFLNINAINIEDAKIWIPQETGTITIGLKDQPSNIKKRIWWKFW